MHVAATSEACSLVAYVKYRPDSLCQMHAAYVKYTISGIIGQACQISVAYINYILAVL